MFRVFISYYNQYKIPMLRVQNDFSVFTSFVEENRQSIAKTQFTL